MIDKTSGAAERRIDQASARRSRVEALKQRVAAGEYVVDAAALAARMLQASRRAPAWVC